MSSLSAWDQDLMLLSNLSHTPAGITQEKINEMRAAPEQKMIADIHCMIAAGQDLDWVDAQGATLVRR